MLQRCSLIGRLFGEAPRASLRWCDWAARRLAGVHGRRAGRLRVIEAGTGGLVAPDKAKTGLGDHGVQGRCGYPVEIREPCS